MSALVCFSGQGHFAHVYVIVRDGWRWIKLDAVAGRLTVKDLGYETPMVRFRNEGLIVIQTEILPGRNSWPAMGATCVGMVKRVIGLRAPFTWTSKQLRLLLERNR